MSSFYFRGYLYQKYSKPVGHERETYELFYQLREYPVHLTGLKVLLVSRWSKTLTNLHAILVGHVIDASLEQIQSKQDVRV